jgi:hypothetical protein
MIGVLLSFGIPVEAQNKSSAKGSVKMPTTPPLSQRYLKPVDSTPKPSVASQPDPSNIVDDGQTPFRVSRNITIKIPVSEKIKGEVKTRTYPVDFPAGSLVFGKKERNALIVKVKRAVGTGKDLEIDILLVDPETKVPYFEELHRNVPRRNFFIEDTNQAVYQYVSSEAESDLAGPKGVAWSTPDQTFTLQAKGTEIWEVVSKADGSHKFEPYTLVKYPSYNRSGVPNKGGEGGVKLTAIKAYPDLDILKAKTPIRQVPAGTPSAPPKEGRLSILAIEAGPITYVDPNATVSLTDAEKTGVFAIDPNAEMQQSTPPVKKSAEKTKPPHPEVKTDKPEEKEKTEATFVPPGICTDCKDKSIESVKDITDGLLNPPLDELFNLIEAHLAQPINNCKISASGPMATLLGQQGKSCSGAIGLHKLACGLSSNQDFMNFKSGKMPNLQISDVLAVDVCTRTCNAEMNGYKCGERHEYLKAVVGSIYNRFSEAYGDTRTGRKASAWGARDLSFPARGIRTHPFINIILKENAYSVWNDNRPKDFKRALCPATKSNQPYYGGTSMIPPSEEHLKASSVCKRECFDAIYDPKKFLVGKESFTQKFYTSGLGYNSFYKMPRMRKTQTKRQMKLVKNAYIPRTTDEFISNTSGPRKSKLVVIQREVPAIPTIDGKQLDFSGCMEIYDDSSYGELP